MALDIIAMDFSCVLIGFFGFRFCRVGFGGIGLIVLFVCVLVLVLYDRYSIKSDYSFRRFF